MLNFHFTIFLTLNNQKRAKLEFVTENTVIQYSFLTTNFSFPVIDIGLEDDIILRRASHRDGHVHPAVHQYLNLSWLWYLLNKY